MQWMRAGAVTPRARRKERQMSSAPQMLAKSLCCKLPLIKLPRGRNAADHFRCSECSRLFVWSGTEWVVCELPDKHRALASEPERRADA